MSVLDSQMLHNPKYASCQFKNAEKNNNNNKNWRISWAKKKRLHMCDVRANGLTVCLCSVSFRILYFVVFYRCFIPGGAKPGTTLCHF